MAKKVTKAELEQIQNFVKQINNGTSQLGQLEIQKHGVLHALSNVQNDLSIYVILILLLSQVMHFELEFDWYDLIYHLLDLFALI